MAEEPEAGRNPSGIARVGKRKWGYDPAQVDEFLDRAHALYEGEGVQLSQQDIQNVSFDLCKGGYVISQVDAALARLERAVTDKNTAWEISQHGRVTWKATTMELFRRVAAHAARKERSRFALGEGKLPSYDRRQVDRLIDQIVAKSAASLGVDDAQGDAQDVARKLVDLNAAVVSNVVFTQRKGKHGYDERQVDYYLSSCVELLSRIESYEHLSDYSGGSEVDLDAMSDIGTRTEVIAPIAADTGFGTGADSPSGVGSLFDLMQKTPSSVSRPSEDEQTGSQSFEALNDAEREIFRGQSESPTEMPQQPVPAPVPLTVPLPGSARPTNGQSHAADSTAPTRYVPAQSAPTQSASSQPEPSLTSEDSASTPVFTAASTVQFPTEPTSFSSLPDEKSSTAESSISESPTSEDETRPRSSFRPFDGLFSRGRHGQPVAQPAAPDTSADGDRADSVRADGGRTDAGQATGTAEGSSASEDSPSAGENTSGDSSLAALAHLAEETNPAQSTDFSMDVNVPHLTMPHVVWASAPDVTGSESGSESIHGTASERQNAEADRKTSDGDNFGIPDLSFPVFGDTDFAARPSVPFDEADEDDKPLRDSGNGKHDDGND
ncbi:DivIVA domain-containing protein [uncultured Bifidobacterium sp.]|uniref:DivIVA domain-containing protein n=1 Tax=uncultured Bifidobacterium sp. TaxID=165187 RepID=UPI00261D5563|nr:DivIVA domain-containing protein [uncultured Bifidobacterium sp.]